MRYKKKVIKFCQRFFNYTPAQSTNYMFKLQDNPKNFNLKSWSSPNRLSWLYLINLLIVVAILLVLSLPTTQNRLVEIAGLEDKYVAENPTKIDFSTIEKAKVNRIVDGDTAILEDSRRVRYLNIDTPESAHPNKPVQCFGKEAAMVNKDLVEGKEIWLKFDREKEDKYGRLLAFVFLPGKNPNDVKQSVNAYLVEMGYARAYIIKPNDTFAEEFAKLEREARNNKRGLWGSCPKPFEG